MPTFIKKQYEREGIILKILVIGGGGREHAIVWKLAQSPAKPVIYCAPGNAGISRLAECVDISARDIDGLLTFALSERIDLTVVGMDDALMLGVVDKFEDAGLKIFGPRLAAAEIEGSKVFSKRLMARYGIPTAAYAAFGDYDEAEAYLRAAPYPLVVKADGLALGKGVVIANDFEEARRALEDMMLARKFGASGERVVIEEFLTGPEVSVLAFCDGQTLKPMISARDHKRSHDGGAGLNTGGMGAVSPAPGYDEATAKICMETIFLPTLAAMNAEGRPFTGVLFFGLMLTANGPKILEYNARFGDPEAQAVLPLLKTDLLDILLACVESRLRDIDIQWDGGASVCVVLASGGYPLAYKTGFPIKGLELADTPVFHAGTRADGADIVTAGGRVLGVTGFGPTVAAARAQAYANAARIDFAGKHYRTDIGGGIRHLYVEKKPGFDIEARGLCASLNRYFGLELESARVVNCYFIENMPDAVYEQAKRLIFSEPPADIIYEGALPGYDPARGFTLEYLPGQYDQRADSAAQCVRLISESDCLIAAAKAYIFGGNFGEDVLERIKRYIINPVDQHEIPPRKTRLALPLQEPPEVPVISGFTALDGAALEALYQSLGLAMSRDDFAFVRDYFRDGERRDPTMTEIKTLDTYWSDHCRHTTFLTEITELEIEGGRFSEPIKRAFDEYKRHNTGYITLMDIATSASKQLQAEDKTGAFDDLDHSDEINACGFHVAADVGGAQQDWLVLFKNETHNHPTEIEPFGGAATCLGGAIRDPLSGRAYVYQAMRLTGGGDPRRADTLPGKLPQRKITTEAAHGYSSYGNQVGLATGFVREIYDEGFVAKRMEVGAVIGAAPASSVRRETPAPGDAVLLIGGRTGLDGLGGATGSSKAHTRESIETCGAEVQKGNPPTERKIQRLFRNPEAAALIKRCNDFGAGGVAVAVGELAAGVRVNLDAVKKKYEGLDGTALAISESQERMAVVVAAEDAERFIQLARDENLEAAAVAVITGENRLQMDWRGARIVDISRGFLDTNGVRQRAAAKIAAPDEHADFFNNYVNNIEPGELKARWLAMLSGLNVCSQQGLVERFDGSIGAGAVLSPFGGAFRRTPAEVMVSKLPVPNAETNTCTIMAQGCEPAIAKWSPFHGAVYAVVDAAAKIAACGGDWRKIRLSLQEYFERLGGDPAKWGRPAAALLGARCAQLALGIPAIGGKDSMSGSFGELSVPPTVAAFGVAAADCRDIITPEFKAAGHTVIIARVPRDEREMPDFDALRRVYEAARALIQNGSVIAAHTVRGGGAAETVSKMCFGNRVGFRFDDQFPAARLFAPDYGSLALELSPGADASALGADFAVLGRTISEPAIIFHGETIPLAEALEAWESPLSDIFPIYPPADKTPPSALIQADQSPKPPRRLKAPAKIAKPRVFIPVFPGTNCEYDTARAFELAGAAVQTFVFKNLSAADISESIGAMRRAIENVQIIALPGGFSAGDEPDGSGKFIATVFRSPLIQEATEALLARDGLILGICNGFQALIKLGLLPYGHICDPGPDAPTLTFNTLGRHISKIAVTRAETANSPWLAGVAPGETHAVAISHGEGRFVCSAADLETLIQNDQIAFRYAPAYPGDAHYNPNGSAYDIEGIISPCGRILGKMGHSERAGANLYKNVPGAYDQRIFASGVGYYL